MNSEEIKYYETLSKLGVKYTEKSEEIIEAFIQLKGKQSSSVSFSDYVKSLSKYQKDT